MRSVARAAWPETAVRTAAQIPYRGAADWNEVNMAQGAYAPGNYLGASKTGSGNPIPVIQQGPQAGQLDINSLIGQMVDRRKMYYYDTLKFAPGAQFASTPYVFFSNPTGTQDPYNGNLVKTQLETNMTANGMFNPPYDLILFNLGFLFWGNLFDIQTFCRMTWFEFKILEKTQFMGSMLRHPPGMGIGGFSTKSNESSWTNGYPPPDAVWMLGDYKKYIPPLVKFTLTLNAPESYNTFYNSVLPADIVTQGVAGTNLPTTLTAAQGGNGLIVVAILNGLSDGPVS